MLIVMLGTVLQVALWGLLFVVLGEFDEFYDVRVPLCGQLCFARVRRHRHEPPRWKLLGPLEALCGVLMLGMNAAVLMSILQHVIKSQHLGLNRD